MWITIGLSTHIMKCFDNMYFQCQMWSGDYWIHVPLYKAFLIIIWLLKQCAWLIHFCSKERKRRKKRNLGNSSLDHSLIRLLWYLMLTLAGSWFDFRCRSNFLVLPFAWFDLIYFNWKITMSLLSPFFCGNLQ